MQEKVSSYAESKHAIVFVDTAGWVKGRDF